MPLVLVVIALVVMLARSFDFLLICPTLSCSSLVFSIMTLARRRRTCLAISALSIVFSALVQWGPYREINSLSSEAPSTNVLHDGAATARSAVIAVDVGHAVTTENTAVMLGEESY